MPFNELVKQIESSSEFRNFKKQHPDARLCAGFFIIDMYNKDNKQAIDYKTKESIFSFNFENDKIAVQEDSLIHIQGRPELKNIDDRITIDTEDMTAIAKKALTDNKVFSKLQKIIAVMQKYSGKETDDKEIQIWNVTCMLEGFGIVSILIDSSSGNLLKFEKKSVMDFMRRQK